jgi:hypothetical protein
MTQLKIIKPISTTIKLDKIRPVKFTISLMIKIEREFDKKINDLMLDMTVDEAVKMLSMALAVDEPAITYEKVIDLINEYNVSLNDVMGPVSKALIRAVTGSKGEAIIKMMEDRTEEPLEQNG